jgi:hypothetical protein
MRNFRISAFAAVAAGGVLAMLPALAMSQISISLGLAPACPYGYFDMTPYSCAPPGYYGPEWFSGAVFIGAGPWFHGHNGFRGHVNNSFHPDHGYAGAYPERGERAEQARRVNKSSFRGNEERDGRGHETHRK